MHRQHSQPSLLAQHACPLPPRPAPLRCAAVQHSAGTTWQAPEDEDVPPPVPTLRAMPLRPHAVPTVILAGAPWEARLGVPRRHAALPLLAEGVRPAAMVPPRRRNQRCQPLPLPAATCRRSPLAAPPATAGESAAAVLSQSGDEVEAFDLPDEPAMPLQVRQSAGRRGSRGRWCAPLYCIAPCRGLAIPASRSAATRTRLTCTGSAAPYPINLTPMNPQPQLADFNFDGYTDVLLVSRDGIWAWAQARGCCWVLLLAAALMDPSVHAGIKVPGLHSPAVLHPKPCVRPPASPHAPRPAPAARRCGTRVRCPSPRWWPPSWSSWPPCL